MSPDCIDSTVVLPEKTTMPHPLWVRVNYARLSALRPKLNVPLPEQLKRKIDHSINSGSKKRKIPKRRNRDKVSRKNSRGSSKEHRNIKSDVEFSDDQSNVSNTHPADSSCKAQNDKSITAMGFLTLYVIIVQMSQNVTIHCYKEVCRVAPKT